VTGWWGGHHMDPRVRQAMKYGASQDPAELGAALALVASLAPGVVVEIGCDRGGTLYAWLQVCELVLGITLPDNGFATGGSGLALVGHGAVVRFGDSHDPASVEWLRSMLTDDSTETVAPVDALVIDGDHSVAGVVADVAMYGPLVRPGGVILIHDINSREDPRCQVPWVWPRLAAQYDTATIEGGGPGWGVIHVRESDRFAEQAEEARR
jgi:cephalosporin hydroxylase